MSIHKALEALGGALAGAGVPLWQAPETHAWLDALEAELAPMRLPDEVREFWRQVDVQTLRASPYPQFSTPEFALSSWRMARDEFAAFQPLALAQVGYESHACMSVELDIGELDGGALFEWFVSDTSSGFDRRFNSMAAWVSHVAELIEQGSYARHDSEQGPWLLVPEPERVEAELAERPLPPSHPRYGDMRNIGGDILAWPDHWQRANGLRPDGLSLRGATHTVSDVISSPAAQELRATIAARVVELAGGGAGTRVRVDDGTGTLDVACPSSTTLLGPRIRDWYEFDIVVVPGGPAAATAEAIRRMPAPTDATG